MSIFHFKQFSVDQTGCAMKVNTDGVLLGAIADASRAETILDIGTGTGVIALMLVQRFEQAYISAVELDAIAAQTAKKNFAISKFADRVNVYCKSFQQYFAEHHEQKFDVIVSNPPFYIQSLPSAETQKTLAKHADDDFFKELISNSARHLNDDGVLWLILPLATSALVKQLASSKELYLQSVVSIHSYPHSNAHREILALGRRQTNTKHWRYSIYSEPKLYTDEYRNLLKDFLTIF
ncbi:tRNA1(Val) (adenine(37)-N6)-methyltransferase [Mucilaginibacter aquatilis]|uniref:tRNA1(Val) (adenine(37)-N6)-methyltransferase n=1 Tax=Mucilaginibacter aquatilis TaxID=1517760 RepID=A0A6I4IQK0_9SPHI|nr:methyltransferase [Mucilaginibacter aquatilis]MVN91833.1 methyltransferase [Mucilaginibacter aquatilis]